MGRLPHTRRVARRYTWGVADPTWQQRYDESLASQKHQAEALQAEHEALMRKSSLRSTSWKRGCLLLIAGAAAFLGAGLLIAPAESRQDRLAATGVPVEGTVIDAFIGLRGPNTVTVRYEFQGTAYEEHIVGSGAYTEGETVTVYVDAEHPASATLPGEQPQSTVTFWATTGLIAGSFLLAGAGVMTLWRWWRQR